MSADSAPAASATERPRVDVFLAGALFFDLVLAGIEAMPTPGTEVWARARAVSPGGVANRAVAAARLGLRTGLAGRAGTDLFGSHLWQLLHEEANLDLRWSELSPAIETALTVSVTQAEDRRFLSHGEPDWESITTLTPERLPLALAAQLGVTENAVPAWARQLRGEGTLLFGGVGWDATERWSPDVLANLEHFDALVLNTTEATAYTRTDDPTVAAKQLAERVPLVAVTGGDQGAVAVDAATGELTSAPALTVEAVDPTGAGDVFFASFIFGTLAEWPLRERLLFANLCAGHSVRTLGGAVSAPTWEDLNSWLMKYDPQGEESSFAFLGPEVTRRTRP
ncbi:carbohydrate kinase family protein [Actinopolymorpha alba]|uniref:carbohydrate kinase family protein n=1 Tax=Actinopolymorpha alba TaxID=533267 RepID=UPI0003665E4C|nr:PfkB family carbohydrate kinase [Actinopolymorpha alba]